MKSEERTKSEIELENCILKLKTDILKLIVKGESFTNIIHVINQKHADIQTKVESIEEYYKEVKKFRDDLEKFNYKLDDISEATEKSKTKYDGLREYVQTIEGVTNSSVLMFKFLDQSNNSARIVEETREVLQKPQKHLNFVLQRLEPKLKMEGQLRKVEDVTEHLDYLSQGLSEEENNLWDKIRSLKGIQKLHSLTDDETMTFYEEVEDNYNNWQGYLKDIKEIKEHWETHRRTNPINPLYRR